MAVLTRTRSTMRRGVRPQLAGFLFVLPCFALFVVFRFGPAVAGVLMSFSRYYITGNGTWAGLENYTRLVDDPVFWSALRVTVVYAVIAVPTTIALSIGFALMLRRGFRGFRIYRSVFFLPVVTSLVLAGVVFKWIFSEQGPWASTLHAVHFPVVDWLQSETFALPAVALVGVWSRFGYGMLIVLARLQEMPRDVEEAAMVDGAGTWHRFRHVLLPHLRPAIFFLAIVETTFSFQVFDTVYVMTGGGPIRSTYGLVYQVYDQGFRNFDLGYASAIGVALFVMTLIVALIQRTVIGRSES